MNDTIELWELCPHNGIKPHLTYWGGESRPCPGGKKHEVVTEIGVHADGTHTLPMPTGLPPGWYLLVREDR
jgi:hypothetical protein